MTCHHIYLVTLFVLLDIKILNHDYEIVSPWNVESYLCSMESDLDCFHNYLSGHGFSDYAISA